MTLTLYNTLTRRKEVFEQSAFLGDAINMRRLRERMAHAAKCVPTQIIQQDEDDVRPGWLARGAGVGAAELRQRQPGEEAYWGKGREAHFE